MGAIAIVGIMAVQTYWVLKTLDLKEKQFDESVRIGLLNTAKELSKLTRTKLPTEKLINRSASNYYIVNLNDQINPDDLEFYLKRELGELSFQEDFEYGIYDCTSDEMVYGAYVSFDDYSSKTLKDSTLNLSVHDEFVYYFGVRFPNKTNFLLNSMTLTIIFSLILLIAIIYFVISMYIIMYQKQLSQIQYDFINNMTHEFKTPISTINIATDVLLKNKNVIEDPRMHRYAQIIKEQNNRLNSQVENVLQTAKMDKKNLSISKEKIHLNNLITDLSDSILMKVQEKNGRISFNLDAKQDLIIADKMHLTNVIYNLLDNALKYSDKTPEIEIATEDKGELVVFKIKDNGVGIKEENLDKLFQKFYRVPVGNVHNVKGFGLGLFYVKYICNRHNWKIDVESKYGEGTTFIILIKSAFF